MTPPPAVLREWSPVVLAPPAASTRAVVAGIAALLLSACAPGGTSTADRALRPVSTPGPLPPAATAAAVPAGAPDPARDDGEGGVRPLEERRQPDVLVVGDLPGPARERLSALAPAGGSVAFRAGPVRLGERDVRAVAVDPSSFRSFTAPGTAEADGVWQAVARGEAVVSHATAQAAGLVLGQDVVVTGPTSTETLRLGALATTGVPSSELVVGDEVGRRLGLAADSGLLLTVGDDDAASLAQSAREVAGEQTQVELLTAPAEDPVAFLTGGDAAQDLGAFRYRYYADGTIEPDAAWVEANIRTETVPVLGRVTCHRLMLPQLRGALQDVEDAGLASALTTYDGCYVPRFIARDPDRSISLHTWGIAIDLDAATNYRGIRGTMDSRVVEIFKRWGFRWGGDWAYTDPMHFELGTLLERPRH